MRDMEDILATLMMVWSWWPSGVKPGTQSTLAGTLDRWTSVPPLFEKKIPNFGSGPMYMYKIHVPLFLGTDTQEKQNME